MMQIKTNKQKIVIHNVHIPFPGEKCGEWITPYWEDVLRFYPQYYISAKKYRFEPHHIESYIMYVASEIKTCFLPEYTKNKLIDEYEHHFGSNHYKSFCKETDEINSGDLLWLRGLPKPWLILTSKKYAPLFQSAILHKWDVKVLNYNKTMSVTLSLDRIYGSFIFRNGKAYMFRY